MRTELVEIYSDQTNAAVMRHPGRRFPGVLLQGDTLAILCKRMERILRELGRDSPACEELDDIFQVLSALKAHYKQTLDEHGLPLPYFE